MAKPTGNGIYINGRSIRTTQACLRPLSLAPSADREAFSLHPQGASPIHSFFEEDAPHPTDCLTLQFLPVLPVGN